MDCLVTKQKQNTNNIVMFLFREVRSFTEFQQDVSYLQMSAITSILNVRERQKCRPGPARKQWIPSVQFGT